METKLNDNEVREVAEMQKKIDTYESFILTIFAKAKFKEDMNYLITTEVPIQKEMNFIWRFVKEHMMED